MTVIDAHQHFWVLAAHDQPFLRSHPSLAPLLRDFTVGELAPQAAAAGVTGTVVVQTVLEPGETPELLELAAAGGLVAGVVGWADLEAPDVADAIAGLRELPGGNRLSGLRHPLLGEPDLGWLTRPAVLRGLAALGKTGLAFDIVAQPGHLAAAAQAAAETGELRFVLDHLGNPELAAAPDPSWTAAVTALAAHPNVTCKLSGILGAPPPGTDPAAPRDPADVAHLRPYYEIVLGAFGPDRLMFGSDWPVSTLSASYGDVVAAARALTSQLSKDEQDAIFSRTAQRVYQLPG
jgi:L-fuconolactonase